MRPCMTSSSSSTISPTSRRSARNFKSASRNWRSTRKSK
uniref:Uncharacterized protein n=1 Tax=Siphoviridae sp. ctksc2 TaxID=2825645 RepID=A0A8S5URZ0_9CAUD|nr:MAG TPA: hypothetical protein [Siphoviridae sp. ctksc2]